MGHSAHHIHLVATALMTSLGNKQSQIAARLKVSPGQVAKLVNEARWRGYLKVKAPEFVQGNITPDELRQAKDLLDIEHDGLRKALGAAAEAAGVTSFSLTVVSWDRNKERDNSQAFGRAAAPRVKALLASAKTCGVSWGPTLRSLALALAASGRAATKTQFLPVVGDPVGGEITGESSSSLAQQLAETLGGKRAQKVQSLSSVPPLLPLDISPEARRVMLDYISWFGAYATIFKGGEAKRKGGKPKRPAIEQLDAILTSVSHDGRPLGRAAPQYLKPFKHLSEELPKLAVGDISGVLLPKEGAPDPKHILEKLKQAWMGITESHFKSCVQRANGQSKGSPGVIVVAYNAKRAETVRRVVQHGMVNHLIVDTTLANALRRSLGGIPSR